MPPETKLNSKGETLYRTPGGNAWTTKDPNRVTAMYTPIEGENAGQRVSLKADGTKTVAPKSGITTSNDAENRAKNADKTINDITTPSNDENNPFADLFSRINTLQADLNKAKEAEKKAKDDQANADVQAKLKGTPSAEEVATTGNADMNAAATAINGEGTTQNIQDPVIRALADKTIANVGIINNQMQTLSQYRQQFNEYTQQDIDSIARTAERSIQRQVEENKRTTDAMRFAGVLAGRAQFAPVTEQSIIAEVIQDGLDKIEVINEKKNSAIREARKAEAEFNVDIFEQQAELAKEYNNEIESTISKMNAQVRQVEADERERTKFRQEQEERNSLILAEELIDATPEQIAQAAAANGIDIGLLSKAINDAKFEKANREFEAKNQALTLEEKRASIAKTWKDYNEETDKIVIPKDVEQGLRSAGLSRQDAEGVWMDIEDFGLDGAVPQWLESGVVSVEEAKAIVSAHEQSQRIKGTDEAGNEDVYIPTNKEKALHAFIDNWNNNKKMEKVTKNARFQGDTAFSTTSFFK